MATTHILDPNAPGTFGATNLSSATEFSYDAGSTESLLETDGAGWIQAVFIDGKHYRVTVNIADATILPGAAGACGDLVLRTMQRACEPTTRRTYTFTGATFLGSSRRVGTAGLADATLNFLVPGRLSEGAYIDPLAVATV